MSKDRGTKNVKKAPAAGGKTSTSDYQASKKSTSRDDASINKKK